MRRLAFLSIVLIAGLRAQTTQGLISGRILDSVSGQPVANAEVSYASEAISAAGTLHSDASGYYFLPLLSAGTYTIRAAGDKYQPQELQQLELPVAGRVQLDFRLRPLSDVWESGQYRSVFLPGTKTIVTIYGPDVDPGKSGTFEAIKGQRGTLDTSASYVIDPVEIGALPLLGRDVYSMLVSLPTVGADSGTGRGLGVSVAGQRPSSSNYLLDGVENDNYLITGPLLTTAPEAIQEYRISTNDYSAEYGRTAGFVANAVTKAGSARYHGIAYEYLKNTALNAADFQDNLKGMGRRPDKENEFGYQAGGPVVPKGSLRNRLFFSSALDELVSHSNQDPATYNLPAPNFFSSYASGSDTQLAKQLLTEFPPPVVAAMQNGTLGNGTGTYTVAQPVVVDRLIALERGDYTTKGGKDRFMARLALGRTSEPDFIWTPYPQFVSGLYENTTGIAGNWQRTWSPRITSELKFSFNSDNLWWDRAHPEIPTLTCCVIGSEPENNGGVLVNENFNLTLPGSPAYYAYRNDNKTPEIVYSTVWTRNRHILTAGLGLLFRYNSGYLTAGRDSAYIFNTVGNFALDGSESGPSFLLTTLNRLTGTPVSDYNRAYRYNQSYFFVQDSFRVSPRLTLNFGLRYENFGAPSNTGAAKDAIVTLGPGTDLTTALANSSLTTQASGSQQLYGADNKDWAPRFGFSWDPFGKSKTVLRGGFGIFYDRPFDNLWQNVRNNIGVLATYSLYTGLGGTSGINGIDYLKPVVAAPGGGIVLQDTSGGSHTLPAPSNLSSQFPDLTLMDPKLKNGYTQTSFLGVQQQITDNLTIEVNGTSALGRRLVSTDIVNRDQTYPYTIPGFTDTFYTTPNPNFPLISWRSDQGLSDYYALSTRVRYRAGTLLLQGAYTWSHSIDNQSDPLQGDFFNLDFVSVGGGGGNSAVSTFAQQYNSNGDRGNSEFDQRHNLFIVGIWQPRSRWLLTRGWQISWLAAFRTGTPYTVTAPIEDALPNGGGYLQVQRADLLNPATARTPNPAVCGPPGGGGVVLLNCAAFADPGGTVQGNTGRDAFTGPGLYDVDFSLARSFSVPKLHEGAILTVRADFFNILNHANLGNPDSLLGDPNFGLSTYGRQGVASGFPAVTPLNETARQIQLIVRLIF